MFLIYGPPGSGKTTIANNINFQGNIAYISTGDVTRGQMSKGGRVGKELDYYHKNSLQYPKDLIRQVMTEAIKERLQNNNIALLDGYPKYFDEVLDYTSIMQELGLSTKGIIRLQLPIEESWRRIKDRFICPECNGQISMLETSECKCPQCGTMLTKRWEDDYANLERRYKDHMEAVGPVLDLLAPYCSNILKVDASMPLPQILHIINSFIYEQSKTKESISDYRRSGFRES